MLLFIGFVCCFALVVQDGVYGVVFLACFLMGLSMVMASIVLPWLLMVLSMVLSWSLVCLLVDLFFSWVF